MFLTSRLLFIFIFFVHVNLAAGALDSLRIEKKKGSKFIIHQVDQGETLYSISKRYACSIEDILSFNPGAENGLKVLQELQIPLALKKKHKKPAGKSKEPLPDHLHIVQPGETLFAISRLSDLSVDSLKIINRLTGSSINVGDTLIIKLLIEKEAPKALVSAKENLSDSVKAGQDVHIVQPSETLFGLARKYNVSVQELTKWNGLNDFNLAVGQKLLISGDFSSAGQEELLPNQQRIDTVKTKPVMVTVDSSQLVASDSVSIVKKTAPDTTFVRTDNRLIRSETMEIDGKLQIMEEGFAMKIEDTEFTSKLLALHRTAPLGATVRIRNQMNGREIDVRVVGSLPNSADNQNVLLRMSAAAYNNLGALDIKIPVTTSYVKE